MSFKYIFCGGVALNSLHSLVKQNQRSLTTLTVQEGSVEQLRTLSSLIELNEDSEIVSVFLFTLI
jgi:hypothetical protein